MKLSRDNADLLRREWREPIDKPVNVSIGSSATKVLHDFPSYLLREFADTKISVESSLLPVFKPHPQLNDGSYYRRVIPIGDAFRCILDGTSQGTSYISALSVSDAYTKYRNLVGTNPFDFGMPEDDVVLFFGPKRSGTFWHYDLPNIFLVVAHGEKQVELVSPAHSRLLSPYHFRHRQCHRYANVARSKDGSGIIPTGVPVQRVSICSGQGIVIPAHWWHQARNQSDCISLSFIWNRKLVHRLSWLDTRCVLGNLTGSSSKRRQTA